MVSRYFPDCFILLNVDPTRFFNGKRSEAVTAFFVLAPVVVAVVVRLLLLLLVLLLLLL